MKTENDSVPTRLLEISGHRSLPVTEGEFRKDLNDLSVTGKVTGNSEFRIFRSLLSPSAWDLPFIPTLESRRATILEASRLSLYVEDGACFDLRGQQFRVPIGVAFGGNFRCLITLHESERETLGENFILCLGSALIDLAEKLRGKKVSVFVATQMLVSYYEREALELGVDVRAIRSENRQALKSYFKLLKEVWC